MRPKIHLWIEEPIETEQTLTVQARIESSLKREENHHLLWYRLPREYRSDITTQADPFVIGTLFMAMHEASDLIVHGEVSPSLLRNLEEFQSAWALWLPETYTKIDIIADRERDGKKIDEERAIVAFSGGVDASFTLWRHRTNHCGRLRRNIEAGIFVHGFDVPLKRVSAYEVALKNASKMVNSLGSKLIPISTNLKRDLGDKLRWNWDDYHAVAIISCMMILKGRYNIGLVGSSYPYNELVLPWGSNPVTDHLLSCTDFQIIHDGADTPRLEKINQMATWSEAMEYLRVCWEGSHKDRNCCCCEKCTRTILGFRVMGKGLPKCFEQDVSDEQILNLTSLTPGQIQDLNEVYVLAEKNSISEPWVKALQKCIRKNSREGKIIKRLKKMPTIRRWFYNSPIIQRVYHHWQKRSYR